MEALAAGASIAGLLGLAGQCITGAQKLQSLYRHVASASKSAAAILKDINSLLKTLDDVQELLKKIELKSALTPDDVQLTTLKLQLDDYNGDIGGWLETAQKFRSSTGGGTNAWFKRFWLATNKDCVKNVRVQIHQRRMEIAVALSTLGRYDIFSVP